MFKTWLHTDLHFYHRALIEELAARPWYYQEAIIRNWWDMISPDDLVFILGDLALNYKPSELSRLLKGLPGRKGLVRGNHDHEKDEWYLENGFDFVCQSMVYKNVLLTHAPASVLPGNAVINVHGHLHNDSHRKAGYNLQPWHRLLAIEETDYKPVLWTEFCGPEPLISLT